MNLLVPELGHSAGSETVLLRVLPQWVEAGHAVTLAAPAYRLVNYKRRGLDARVRRVELGWADAGWRGLARRLEYRIGSGWLRAAGFRDQARRTAATHVFLPWVVDQPVIDFGLPTGVMVMDLAWWNYPPGWFGKSAAELDQKLGSWLRAADAIFPVSEATAADLITAFPEQAGKLTTVPHGARWRGLARSDEVTGRFFLTPASLTPNKDHATLLQAAVGLWREGFDFRLIWTGRGTDAVTSNREVHSAETQALQACYRENATLIAGRLEVRGFVTDEELDRLYAGAVRVVLPSTYEGFGLPVMEALERGTRVICTDIAPFREQMQRHGLESRAAVVPARNEDALAGAMRAALTEDNRTSEEDDTELRRRVESWTWEDAARSYLDHLERL